METAHAYQDAYKGTPWFTLAMRHCGWDLGPGSIILGNLCQEISLLHSGRDLVFEEGGGVSTHYIQSGRIFFVPVQ